MDLKYLRYFVIAAGEENFRRAAEKLHVAQPALSRRIRDLELDLGIALFERERQRVRLSAAGRAYFLEAVRILKDLETACELARQATGAGMETLTIGFDETVLRHPVIARLLGLFHQRHPDVALKFDASKRPMPLEALAERGIERASACPAPRHQAARSVGRKVRLAEP
jgi:DNA-binding transcriptional LysR family regulator